MNDKHQPPHPAAPRRPWLALAVIVVVVMGGSQAADWWRTERSAALVRQHARATDITLYTTSTCPYCAKARAWLTRHGVPWRECNVETDATCGAVFAARGSPGVPLVHARGQWHLGFDPAWLGEVLHAAPPAQVRAQPSPSSESSPRP